MHTSSIRLFLLIAMSLLPVHARSQITAQAFPTKAVRLVVPAPPGGGTDVFARTIAAELARQFGQAFIADNRPGASGIIGSDLVAKAPPDGHTLLMSFTSHVTNPVLQPSLPYDTLKDFASISMVAVVPSVLVVHPSVPARSLKELLALARAKPGVLDYASAGTGTATHLSAVLLRSMADVDIVHVAYKGASPALTDLLGGQVALMFGNMVSTLPHIRSGRLRALAVTGAERAKVTPELPTMAESGLPGYEATAWFALFAPAKTPVVVIERLNAEVVAALRLPQLQQRLASQGAEASPSTPAELDRRVRGEIEKWTRVIREIASVETKSQPR